MPKATALFFAATSLIAASTAFATEIQIQPEAIPAEFQREIQDASGMSMTVVAAPVEIEATGTPGEYELRVLSQADAGPSEKKMIETFNYRSFKVSSSQILTAEFGMIVGRFNCENVNEHCSIDGVILEAEPGIGGMKAAIGLGTTGVYSTDVFNGIEFKLGGIYKWNSLGMGQTGNLYVGPEIDLRFLVTTMSVGLLKNVSGDDVIFNASIGFQQF